MGGGHDGWNNRNRLNPEAEFKNVMKFFGLVFAAIIAFLVIMSLIEWMRG